MAGASYLNKAEHNEELVRKLAKKWGMKIEDLGDTLKVSSEDTLAWISFFSELIKAEAAEALRDIEEVGA